jgi:hypothetical protein
VHAFHQVLSAELAFVYRRKRTMRARTTKTASCHVRNAREFRYRA